MTKTQRKAYRLYALVAVALTVAVSATVWFWPRGDDRKQQQAQTCWRILAELGTESSGSISSCGDALETAMTGKPAGLKATGSPGRLPDAQSQAFEHVLTAYAAQTIAHPENMPPEIRMNMANALTYYRIDVAEIMSGNVEYSDPDFSTDPNDIDIGSATMAHFLEPVAEDETAIQLVRESMFEYLEEQITSLGRDDFAKTPKPEETSDPALGAATEAGRVAGFLRRARFYALTRQNEGNEDKLRGALNQDYRTYGLPRVDQLLLKRAASLNIPDTPQSKARLEEIRSWAMQSYSTNTAFQDR